MRSKKERRYGAKDTSVCIIYRENDESAHVTYAENTLYHIHRSVRNCTHRIRKEEGRTPQKD